METRSVRRRKLLLLAERETASRTDRISDLPDALLYLILLLLPIKSIAQTSVLSKRWRSLWYCFPDLDFTTIYPDGINLEDLRSKAKTSRTLAATVLESITQVLALRDKHSDVKTLRFLAYSSLSRLNGLFRRAIRHNVQQLDVEIVTDDRFNFPLAVIRSESLRILRLKSLSPGIYLPPISVMKDGFRFLHTLSLSSIVLYKQPLLMDLFSDLSFPHLKILNLEECFGLKRLSVNCRALEDFSLGKSFQLQSLNISGPKLERLYVESCFSPASHKNYVKINAPRLKIFHWQYNAVPDRCVLENLSLVREVFIGFFVLPKVMSGTVLQGISTLLSGLSHARCLRFEGQGIEVLSSNDHFFVHLHPFHHLKSLELEASLNKDHNQGLACLFKSSPALHTLTLKIMVDNKMESRKWNRKLWDMSTSDEEKFWESHTQTLNPFLRHLKLVRAHGLIGSENEVSLAKFLLKHGKALQEMTLCTGGHPARASRRRQKIWAQMSGFSWASSNVKFVLQ